MIYKCVSVISSELGYIATLVHTFNPDISAKILTHDVTKFVVGARYVIDANLVPE